MVAPDCDAPIGTKTYWTSLQRNLVDQLVRTRTMQIQRNATLKLYSRVGETPEQFAARCVEAADAAADQKLASVRDKYKPRYDKARAALAAAQDQVGVHESQAKAARNDGVVGALLGGFLGGRSSVRTMSRSISRSQGRASTANKRLDSAKNRADEKQDALADLEQEFEADLAEVHAEADSVAAAIDSMTVPLEKTDVKVVDIALVWVPQA